MLNNLFTRFVWKPNLKSFLWWNYNPTANCKIRKQPPRRFSKLFVRKEVPSWKLPLCLMIFKKASWKIWICSVTKKFSWKKWFLVGEQMYLPGKLLFGEHIKPPGKIQKKVLLEEKIRYFRKLSRLPLL